MMLLKTARGRGRPAAAAGPTGGPRVRLMSRDELGREIASMCHARGLLLFAGPDGGGFPDLIIAGLGGVIYVALRTARTGPRPGQRLWLDTLGACGCEVHAWRPAHLVTGEIRRVLDRIQLAGPPAGDAL